MLTRGPKCNTSPGRSPPPPPSPSPCPCPCPCSSSQCDCDQCTKRSYLSWGTSWGASVNSWNDGLGILAATDLALGCCPRATRAADGHDGTPAAAIVVCIYKKKLGHADLVAMCRGLVARIGNKMEAKGRRNSKERRRGGKENKKKE